MSVISAPLTPTEIVLEEQKIKHIQRWVLQTQFHHPPADPFTPATPPITVSAGLPSPPPSPMITTPGPLFMNMTSTPRLGPMIPPVVFNPRIGAYEAMTQGYIQPAMTTMPVIPGPTPVVPAAAPTPVLIEPSSSVPQSRPPPLDPNASAGFTTSNINTMPPPNLLSHGAPVHTQSMPPTRVPSQPQGQPIPAFIPPRRCGRSRSRDRHHHHRCHHRHHQHHGDGRHHSCSRGRARGRSHSPVAAERRGRCDRDRDHPRARRVDRDDDDVVNPPLPPDYVPASPGPEHTSHRAGGLAGIGSRAAGAVSAASAALRRDGHGHGHDEGKARHRHDGRVYSHDYAQDLSSSFRHLSVGGGAATVPRSGGVTHTSSARPTYVRHRSRSIDDRDLQRSRARSGYANTGIGGYQYPPQTAVPVQYQQPQYYPHHHGAAPTIINPLPIQPTIVPQAIPTASDRRGRQVLLPPNQQASASEPPSPRTHRSPFSSFFSRLFPSFGRRQGVTSGSGLRPIQPPLGDSPVQYAHRYMPRQHHDHDHHHHHHHQRGHDDRKLTKKHRRRDTY